MTQGKITASAAMLNVLKTWGVDTIYGIPSGTLSSLMDLSLIHIFSLRHWKILKE